MCPQKQAQCGETQEVEFAEIDEEQELTVTGLSEGESCTYKIKSSKGSPCFKLKDDSTTTDEKVEISYIEFEGDRVEKSEAAGTTSEDSPEEGLPKRDQSFEDSGNQGEKGGQKKPRRQKADGTKTEDEDLDEEKEYVKEKKEKDEEGEGEEESGWFKKEKDGDKEEGTEKPRPEEGESMEETDAVEGYGQPTKGTYSSTEKGYKTFGTTGQGENKEGAKESDASEEKERTVIVSVTALVDQDTDTILLETGNYEFLEEYTWEEESAKYLTFAGVVGLIGATMI